MICGLERKSWAVVPPPESKKSAIPPKRNTNSVMAGGIVAVILVIAVIALYLLMHGGILSNSSVSTPTQQEYGYTDYYQEPDTYIQTTQVFTQIGTQEQSFGHTYKIGTVLDNQYVLV